MDGFRSSLSPIDAGLDPGSYPMPDSPSLSASTDRDLFEARVRASNMVAPCLVRPGPSVSPDIGKRKTAPQPQHSQERPSSTRKTNTVQVIRQNYLPPPSPLLAPPSPRTRALPVAFDCNYRNTEHLSSTSSATSQAAADPTPTTRLSRPILQNRS